MKGQPPDRAVRDLKTCVDELVNNPKVNKDKIGCIGRHGRRLYCRRPQRSPHRGRARSYGRAVDNPETLQPLKATILGVFGEKDTGIPVATVRN